MSSHSCRLKSSVLLLLKQDVSMNLPKNTMSIFFNFLLEKGRKLVYFLLQTRSSLSFKIQIYFYSKTIISSHGYSISEFYDVMVILCNSCHKIHSSLNENCKDKLFNVTPRIKEKKLKICFSSQGKSANKFNFTVFSNCYNVPEENKK